MKDIRQLFENKERILEKNDGYKVLVSGARLVSSPNSIEDLLILDVNDYGYEYEVDSEDVKVSSDNTIEFESLGAKYVIRDIREEDDLSNLNPDSDEVSSDGE